MIAAGRQRQHVLRPRRNSEVQIRREEILVAHDLALPRDLRDSVEVAGRAIIRALGKCGVKGAEGKRVVGVRGDDRIDQLPVVSEEIELNERIWGQITGVDNHEPSAGAATHRHVCAKVEHPCQNSEGPANVPEAVADLRQVLKPGPIDSLLFQQLKLLSAELFLELPLLFEQLQLQS